MKAKRDLFLVSFLILFFELAAIRWFGATVVFLTFFTNIVLLATFLGMSIGLLSARRPRNLAPLVLPVALLALAAAVGLNLAYWTWADAVTVTIGYTPQDQARLVFFGSDYKVEFPTGSDQMITLREVAAELSHRLTRIFLRGENGRRPVHGGTEKFQRDPHWKDLILFYEYFHGDNGAGIGASHQTGWTGLVTKLLQQSGE